MRIACSRHFAAMVGNREKNAQFWFENLMEGNKLKDLTVNGNCNFECCIFEALCET